MSRIEGIWNRWKSDYDFKTVSGAIVSLAVTAMIRGISALKRGMRC